MASVLKDWPLVSSCCGCNIVTTFGRCSCVGRCSIGVLVALSIGVLVGVVYVQKI